MPEPHEISQELTKLEEKQNALAKEHGAIQFIAPLGKEREILRLYVPKKKAALLGLKAGEEVKVLITKIKKEKKP